MLHSQDKQTLQYGDDKFSLLIGSEEIAAKVKKVAKDIRRDMDGDVPVFLCVLCGAFVFMSDLMRNYDGQCEVAFIRLSSYSGTETTGKVKTLMGITTDIRNRRVVVVEDIVDTGITMQSLLQTLKTYAPKSLSVATLFNKPDRRQTEVQVDYSCFEIPDKFIVGYGLDYNQQYRNLPAIYVKE